MSSGEADAIPDLIRVATGDYALNQPSRRVIAITGIPGVGKTTLATALAESHRWSILSTGDIGRRVDPAGIEAGRMADEEGFRAAFKQVMDEQDWSTPVIIDGLPRSVGQLALLPYFTRVILLTCRPDIARNRLLRRGRSDDTPELVDTRMEEQIALLDVKHSDGWAYQVAGWERTVNTSMKTAKQIAFDVGEYIDGRKKQAF